jgi:CheY-like chemotaxis protein
MGLGTYKDRQAHPLPGLIFLDLKLNDMQGTDVLRFLQGQKDLSRIAVIVWTSHIGPHDAQEVRDLAIKCCVTKPHSPETLNETIRGLNDYLTVQGLEPVLQYGKAE